MDNFNALTQGKNDITANGTQKDIVTLKDVYYTWTEMNQPRRSGFKNKDRKPNDLKNHERALRCLAAGASGGKDDLARVDAEVLRVNDSLLGRYVEEGAALLNAHRKNAVPSEKTIKNLVFCCKAVRAGLPNGMACGKSLYRVMLERPKLKYRKAFYRSEWPVSLTQDYQGYVAWKMKSILSQEEGERFRRRVCRPVTMAAHTSRLNRYIGYLVRERGLSITNDARGHLPPGVIR